ncbi:transposase family protein [Streptomyces canus]|uniref:transposase family protein n=1 Tax=Streptomyces canus TaxID=58343 RepID=UPI0037100795
MPGLLERLTEVPDPRDPRGVRHALVVLALTACAVLAGTRSLPAVGEWIGDTPPQVLQAVGAPRSSASQAAPACGIVRSPTAGEGRRRCPGPSRGPMARRPPLPHRERASASSGARQAVQLKRRRLYRRTGKLSIKTV